MRESYLKQAEKAEIRLPADAETHESFRQLLAEALEDRFGYDMEVAKMFVDSFEGASY